MNLTFTIFFQLIPWLVIILSTFNYYWDYVQFKLEGETEQELYDFIVVGAGSSGATLASRLSKNNRVLLLEAGGYPLPLMKVPGLAWALLGHKEHDWMYRSLPQKYACLAAENATSAWPRGKVLGGSSALNLMQYVRGHPLDYDNWAELTGDPSWKYDNLLPLFKRNLDYNGEFKDNKLHYENPGEGLLHVEKLKWRPLENYFLAAGKELGFDFIDGNGPQTSGFTIFEFTTKKGVRQDTFTAFLKPFLHRENLKVSPYSRVDKVHINKQNVAYGVSYTRHGERRFARAKREVILSAGAVDSPKLLLLSGIGPKEELRATGIKPIADLPVGKNLQDHVAVWVGPFIINQTGASYINERDFSISTFTDYMFKESGFLVSPAAGGGQAFISTPEVLKTGRDWPNLQLYMLSLGVSEIFAGNIAGAYGFKPEDISEFYGEHYGKDAFHLMVVLVRPKSVGYLKLADKDVQTPPLIDPKYLEHEDDRKALLEGIKFVVKLGEETKSFRELNATLTQTPFPGCENHAFRSDAYWQCYISRFSTNLYHPAGSCSMGNGKDGKSVLDSKLRVIGIKSLRVADASIMPAVVNGNTNAPCIMIGEKAAEIIREYWSEQFQVCPSVQHYLAYSEEKQCFYSRIV